MLAELALLRPLPGIWHRLECFASPACVMSCRPQIADAKEFMKRRFVTKLASRSISYKV